MRILAINWLIQHPYVDNVCRLIEDVSFQNYETVVVDPWPIDDLLGIHPGGNCNQNELFAYLREILDARFTETTLLLQQGGLVVSILRPVAFKQFKTPEGVHSIHNYEWLFGPPAVKRRPPIERAAGFQCEFIFKGSPFKSYCELGGIYSQAYWTGPSSQVIAWGPMERALAVALNREHGQIVLLPFCSDRSGGKTLVDCIRRAQTAQAGLDITPTPPDWLSDYRLAALEDRASARIRSIEDQIAEMEQQLEIAKADLKALQQLRDLLWGSGKLLESAVREAFLMLGFEVKQREPVDLILDCPLGTAYVEIVGSEGMVGVEKVDQLTRYIAQAAEYGPIKGIIVANPFRLEPPSNRPPRLGPQKSLVSREAENFAMTNRYAILFTPDLYRIVGEVLQGKVDVEAVRTKIFETCGICPITMILS